MDNNGHECVLHKVTKTQQQKQKSWNNWNQTKQNAVESLYGPSYKYSALLHASHNL